MESNKGNLSKAAEELILTAQKLAGVHLEKEDSILNKLQEYSDLFDAKMLVFKNSIAEASNKQSLEWSISNADLNSFEFYDSKDKKIQNSCAFVRQILLKFRRNAGMMIPKYYTLNDSHSDFINALKSQIHELVGLEPCIQIENEESFIYNNR